MAQYQSVRATSGILVALGLAAVMALSPAAHAKKVKLKKLPNSLDRHGLVVLQLGPNMWNNATVVLKPGRNSSAHDGFFVEKLKPGKYTLEGITRVLGSSGTYSTIANGTITTTTYAKLPINREFQIEAGKITHLGLLYLIQEPGKPGGEGSQVYILPFENPGPEQRYFQKYYPELAETIKPADVIVPEYSYVNDRLTEIREIVLGLYADDAIKLARQDRRFGASGASNPILLSQSGWASGDLGMVARSREGRLLILDNPAVDRLSHIGSVAGSEWFYSQAGGLLRNSGSSLQQVTTLPGGFFVNNAFKIGEQGLLLVDNQFNFLVSVDAGQSWKQTSDYNVGRKQALRVSHSITGDDVYIIGRDHALLMKQPRVVVVDRKTGEIRPFAAPAKILKHMVAAFETDAGLFVQTEKPLSTPTTLYFQRNGATDWVKNEILSFHSCRVAIPAAEQIEALCGYGRVHLVSRDFGESWQQVQQTMSHN
ncbi:MAG: hypothetical protein KJO54_06260 [Gammaproteobacteria bacterium]|nr:hypothetical protein [Gammaproteobacteria bacterium]NNF61237.1 hypothetical protein [Gammaproteobacteria bacterium]NNM20787.1 hypothetical protein [Gammaproteobacteria bacterium]